MILYITYFIIRIVIIAVLFERNEIIYYLDKWVQMLIALPTVIGVLVAIILSIYVLKPVVTVVFINVDIEGSRVIIRSIRLT